MICGGPPCQGFSMAGHRLSDDPRNQLFKDFINIVEKVKPVAINIIQPGEDPFAAVFPVKSAGRLHGRRGVVPVRAHPEVF